MWFLAVTTINYRDGTIGIGRDVRLTGVPTWRVQLPVWGSWQRWSSYDGYDTDWNYKEGKYINTLHAENVLLHTAKSMMTEAAIDRGVTRDLYIAMGERLDDNKSWAVRIYYKPFVRWIWAGSLIMSIGDVIAISDRRYHFRKPTKRPAQKREA